MADTSIDPEEARNLAIMLGTKPPQISPAQSQMAAPAPAQLPDTAKPSDLSIAPPAVKAPRGTLQGDQAERSRMLQTGAGEDQIYGKVTNSQFGQAHPTMAKILGGLGQGLAKVGDIGLSAVAPSLAINLPGMEYHHAAQVHGLNNQIGGEEKEGLEQAQTANQNAQPQIHEQQLELNQQKANETENHHQAQIDQQLAAHGFKAGPDGKIVPLPYEEMSQDQQAVHDLKASQEEEADATAALKKVQADPNSPQARMAQQRINNAQQTRQIAMQRLGLSEATFNARYHGTDTNGEALPGAMLTDEGKPVGSSFSANVRPTGTERNKADLANSAASQIGDMKSIIAKRPDIFGQAAGRTTDLTVWLGSQDPDAQRFRAARTIAADHLAGTFGGRSEAALSALDSALGQFKDNPEAAMAGLDQLGGANKSFQKAGTVKTAGSEAAKSGPKEGESKTNSSGDKITFKGGKWVPNG